MVHVHQLTYRQNTQHRIIYLNAYIYKIKKLLFNCLHKGLDLSGICVLCDEKWWLMIYFVLIHSMVHSSRLLGVVWVYSVPATHC